MSANRWRRALAAGGKHALTSKGTGGARCTPIGERRPGVAPGHVLAGHEIDGDMQDGPSPRRNRHHAGRSAGTAAVSPGRSSVLQASGSCRTKPRPRRRPWHGRPDSSRWTWRRSAPAGVGRRPDGSSAAGGAVSGVAAPATLGLDEFLLARSMEHDSPTLLFRPVNRNTGRDGPLFSPGAMGLLEQAALPATTRERRFFEVSRRAHLAWLTDQATGPDGN